MKWPEGRELDRAFGPRFPHEYDLTLQFEHIFLTILPSVVFILVALCYLRNYARQPTYTRAGGLKWVELIAAGSLIAIDLASLGFWCTPNFRSATAVGAAVTSCAAACFLAILVGFAYHRSLQSSSVLTGLYLLLSLLFDIAKTRSYFRRAIPSLAGLSTVRTALNFIILPLLEVPKRSVIIDKNLQKSAGKEVVSGFWNRTFFFWLNPTLLFGFKNVLQVDDLSALGPEFSSKELSDRFGRNWAKEKKNSGNALLKASMRTFYAEVFFGVPPRLCLSAFTLVQPLYLRRVISFIGEENPHWFVRTGLILSCVLIFLGVAASRALFQHMNYRGVTMVRGALVPHIFKKTLKLPYSIAKESAAATLMSTDIEGISTGIPQVHEIWAGLIEVCVGLYLLATIIDKATFLVVLPVLASFIISYFIGNFYAKNLGVWNGKIQDRVALTTKVLLQIKSIKMIGLERAVSDQIQKSRQVEITSFRNFRIASALINLVAMMAYFFPPILAIAGGLFWTTFDGKLTAVKAFTTLAVAAVIINPMVDILHAYPAMKGIAACFKRIQTYLILEEVQACQTGFETESDNGEKPNLDTLSDHDKRGSVISFSKASIAPATQIDPVLRNVSFTIQPSLFTLLIGPVGSGKSTVLRAILGEATISEGEFWRRNQGQLAYCGQKAWLRNVSIRANITAATPFERVWYDEVTTACCLMDDFKDLPGGKGDLTAAGSNGANLSGGQKHRVALARAVYSREPILLLDDVLSGLDAEMAQTLCSRLFGAEGLVRKSATTVIFATHSVNFLKVADQALVLDGNGALSMQADVSELRLTDDISTGMGGADANVKSEMSSDLDENLPLETVEIEADLKSRSRGDFSLYKYLSGMIKVFIRIWLEVNPTNNTFFIGYAIIGGSSLLIGMGVICFYYLNMIPENGIKVHKALLDTVLGANLSFLSATDAGSIVNRFSQDMTILTQKLPVAMWGFSYMSVYVLYDTIIIVSGATYSAVLVPFIIAIFYILQVFYLRTSRQMRYLDIEAKAPLYTLFTDMSSPNGLEHIRAFGWQEDFLQENLRVLDYSQGPYYYMYTIQRWLELAMDLIGLFIALILICMTTFFRQMTTQAGLGLSLLNLITYSNMLNLAVGCWTTLETSLGALARLRTFVNTTPQEASCEDNNHVPPQWPHSGHIEFVNVSAKYQATDASSVLDNVSLDITSGQKVAITGRSGSGKTSLLLAILGLVDYTGTIKIDGVDTSNIPKSLLRSHITTISQDAVQLAGSIRQNLLPYDGQACDGRMDDTLLLRTLKRVGLSESISSKGGLSASLSDMSLSEGQMQFLCLARALLHNYWVGGKVVLMDEPTSNMDHETDARIQTLVNEFFANCTVLMITHRPDAIVGVDRRLEVSNGQVSWGSTTLAADAVDS